MNRGLINKIRKLFALSLMTMRPYASVVLFLTSLISITAQNDQVRCGTNHIPRSADYISAHVAYSRQEIVIPIVFHVVYSNAEENLSDEVIHSQVEVINRDYSSVDPKTKDLPKNFNRKVSTPGISFCLASSDPFGNPSSGIVRLLSNQLNSANQSMLTHGERVIKDTELGGSSAWDTEKYLNIWVGARTDDITGDATFPDDPDETESEGIVLDYKVVGFLPEADHPFNLGKTLTHEIGHYLNVFHLFGSETGCFNDDDLVDDTPNQYGPYFGQCEEEVFSCDSRDMDTNFMNFRDDNCLFYFTKGQVERMMHTLFTSRYELISSGTCGNDKPLPPDPLKVAPIIALSNGIEIPLNTLSEQTYKLRLYDLSGRLVWKMNSNPDHHYMIENDMLASNIYILALELKDQLFARKIFIK